MAIAPIANHVVHLGRNPIIRNLEMLALTTFVLNIISSIPKTDALGKFWKTVNRDCYDFCKDSHGIEGLACFWTCVAFDHITK